MDKLTIENNFDFAFSDNSQGKYSIIFMLLSISIKIPVLNDIEKTKSQINIDAISYSSLMFITKYIKILYFNNLNVNDTELLKDSNNVVYYNYLFEKYFKNGIL